VFGVWSGTSFEATLLNIGRSHAQWLLLAVMLGGLFMNAAIPDAFETGGRAFVVPLLLIQAGHSILMVVSAPTRMLRQHYTRLLCWILATAPLWITGAIVEAEPRLLWWAGARPDRPGRDLAGPSRTRPRAPLRERRVRRRPHDRTLPAVPAHRPGRIGPDLRHRPRRCSQDPADGGDRHLCPGHDRRAVGATLRRLLLFGGPLLYLLSQTVYLWAVAGRRSLPRLAGIAALVVAGGLSSLLAACAALGLVAILLLALVVIVVRERDATASRLLTHGQP